MLREDLQDEIPLEDSEPVIEQKPKEKEEISAVTEKSSTPVEEKKEEQIVQKSEEKTKQEEDFESLLDQYLDKVNELRIGDIVKATIVEVHHEYVLVDIGLKSEAIIPIEEFLTFRGELNIKVGDEIEVYVKDINEEDGELKVSKKIADSIRGWEKLESAYKSDNPIVGTVTRATKGGLLISTGINCFMPISQIGLSRIDDLNKWIGKIVTAKILEFDRKDKKVILSRRKLLEEEKRKKKKKLFDTLRVGDIVQGEVKRIMDYGAFVDIGGFDGLLYQDEILYERVDPKSYFKEGDKIKVIVTEIDKDTERIALSMKKLRKDPWEDIEKKYPVGSISVGQVVRLHRFGAIVRLEEGIKGMIHISDMSWALNKKAVKDYVNEGSIVRAIVTEVNKEDKKISLSLRQVTSDPWDEAELKYPEGSIVRGEVINVTKNVAFIRLNEYFEGIIESENLSWDKNVRTPSKLLKRGNETEAVVLKVDREKRKVYLGLKQLEGDPFEMFIEHHKEGDIVSGKITNYASFGAFVELAKNVDGMVHISQVAENRIEDIEQELKVGEKYNFKIIKIDKSKKNISLSRKEYFAKVQQEEVDKYLKKQEKIGVNLGELLKKEMIKKDIAK